MIVKAKPPKKRPGPKRKHLTIELKAEATEYARRDCVLALNPAWKRWLNGLAKHSGRSKQTLVADGLRNQAAQYAYQEPMPARFLM